MGRKHVSYPVVIGALIALLGAAVTTTTALLWPLGNQAPSAEAPPAAAVQAIAGCEADPAALSDLEAAIGAALANSRHLSTSAEEVWRLHSICRQGDWAYAYVKGYWRSSQAPLPSPSEVVLAQLTPEGWQVLLPDMALAYNQGLGAAPEALLPGAARAALSQPSLAPNRPATAYALPFPAGRSAYVIRHWYPALDFSIGSADGSVGTIRNAKAGVAVFVKDSSARECGDPPPDWYCWMAANTLVIQTAPDEYAWYMHMAANSIPDWIQEGVYVPAGVDIGQEGATGWAVSPHLHFQVASWYSCCDGEGDSRVPHWPLNSLYQVNFSEYGWWTLPWMATSQNQSPPEPAQPEPAQPGPAGGPVPDDAPGAEPTPPPPAPPPAAASVGSVCPSPYVVQRGDWLLKIAERCQLTLQAIVAANPGLNPQRIYVGQALNLPGGAAPAPVVVTQAMTLPEAPPPVPTAAAPPAASGSCSGTHVVAAGENLFRIAFNCGLTTAQLASFNGIGSPYTIYVGQTLKFP
jgi:LysM repeat protein